MRFYDIEDIDDIDFTALMRMLPGHQIWNPFSTQGRYIAAMLRSQKTLERYGINSAIRLAHFIGQGLIETGFLRYRGENLNYSADRLLQIFPKYFRDRAEAEEYHRNPEKIANRVYANRMGNGDEASGDGWRYRGRGFFQLTGKNNYTRYGELAGIDLVGNPDIIEKDLKTSIEVAAAFFGKTGLGEFADRNDIPGVSRGINLGNPNSSRKAHHEAERIVWTERALALVVDPQQIVRGGSAGDAADDDVLDIGDSGEAVRMLQRNLDTLGYSVGAVDGVFGRNTRRAVIAFQDEYGLPATGVVDASTANAIDEALDDPRRLQNVERREATEEDLRRSGAADVAKTGQAGNAGAAAGGAGAVAAANETGAIEEAVDAVRETVSGGEETPSEDRAPPAPAGAPQTHGEAPDAPEPAAADGGDAQVVAPDAEETGTDEASSVEDGTDDMESAGPIACAPLDPLAETDPDLEPLEELAADPGDVGDPEAIDGSETPSRSDEAISADEALPPCPVESPEEAPGDDVAPAPVREPADEPADEPSGGPAGIDDAPAEETAPITPPSAPSQEETTTEIREDDGGFTFPKIGGENTNWGTVGLLLGITVAGVFVYARSRQAIKDRVEDYRRH